MDVRSDVWNFKSLKGKVYEVIPINNLSFKYKPIVLVSLIFRFMHRDLKIVCNFFHVCTSRGSPVLRQRFPVCCERCGHLQRSSTRRPYEFWYLPDECWKPEISKMIVKVRIARCIGQYVLAWPKFSSIDFLLLILYMYFCVHFFRRNVSSCNGGVFRAPRKNLCPLVFIILDQPNPLTDTLNNVLESLGPLVC